MPRRKKTDAPAAVPQEAGHSPLGGSGADRYIHCSGSVYLQQLFPGDADDTEFSAEGTEAHDLAAKALTTGQEFWEFGATVDMTRAVQTYLDYAAERWSVGLVEHPVRWLVGLVEHPVRAPAFHPQAYGQIDLAIFEPEPGIALEIIDYKHGIGVQVDGIGNAQTRCYAQWLIDGETWPADRPRLSSSDKVKLTIVQPRGYHPDGPIRFEIITVGELSLWAYNVLRPAMQNAGQQNYCMGTWCHFCPRKLMCPEMRDLAGDAVVAVHALEDTAAQQLAIDQAEGKEISLPAVSPAAQLIKYDDEWLDQWAARLEMLSWFKSAVWTEISKRCIAGHEFANVKRVNKKIDRIWKDKAEEAALETFGVGQAYEPLALKSPAQLEELPGGKDFCKEWAYKPPSELTVAPITDKRQAQKPKSNEQMFSGLATNEGLTADEW